MRFRLSPRRVTGVVLALTAAWIAVDPAVRARGGAAAKARIQDHDACQRPHGDSLGGSLDAGGARGAVVPRRVEGREARPHRVRAPVRAHDVQGLEKRGAGSARLVHRQRRRPGQRRDARRHHGLLADGARAVSAADAVARGRPHGHAAHRRGHVQARARGRQGRAPDARREPALRPAARAALRRRVHGASVQAPGHRQHEGPRGRLHRRRPRVLSHLLRADQCDPHHRRRLRRRPGRAPGRAVLRQDPEAAEGRAARHPARAADDAREAAHDRRGVAAAGRHRRAPHHLRRPSGLVSAAHGVEDPVGRTELADLSQAGVRVGPGAHGLWRRQHHRAPEPVLRGGHRAARPVAGRGGSGA